jgi:hypothetical protein
MRRLMWVGALGGVLLSITSTDSLASERRFAKTAAGGIVTTGNALGLSKGLDENGPGTEDSIGTFTSLDDQSVDDNPANPGNPWFGGTVNDWTQNGSDAALVLDADAQVLYAELVWGGSTAYGTEDVTGDLDSTVTLSFGQDSVDVSPDPATELTLEELAGQGFPVNYYVRSADVTDFVAEHGAGTYAVEGVPATQDVLIDDLNAAGWTLVVAYRDSSERVRNLTIFVGGSFVDEDSTEDYLIDGFCTPPSGAFAGSVGVSAIEGDADREGDSLAIAETDQDAFVTLSGPNNPEQNFFCSQINGPDGELDEAGTFGDRNHDPDNAVNVVGGRQSWDVTEVGVSSGQGHLVNGQTSAVIRTETVGDSYIPTVVAFEIEVNAPDFSDGTGASAQPDLIGLQGTSTVTVALENAGLVSADNLVFFAPLPDGLALDSFSIDGMDGDKDGNAVDASMLQTGVDIGNVDVDATMEVEFVVRSTAAPPGNEYIIFPRFNYDYVMCVGEDALTEPFQTNAVEIDFDPDGGEDGGEVESGDEGDEAEGTAEDDGSGSGVSGLTAGGTADRGDGDSSGCACNATSTPGASVFAVLALLGLRRRTGHNGAQRLKAAQKRE